MRQENAYKNPSCILETKLLSKLVEQNRSNPLRLVQTLIMINDKYIGFVRSIERANNYEQFSTDTEEERERERERIIHIAACIVFHGAGGDGHVVVNRAPNFDNRVTS